MEGDSDDEDICDSFKPTSLKIIPKDHFKKRQDDFQFQLKQIKIMDVEMAPEQKKLTDQEEQIQIKDDKLQQDSNINKFVEVRELSQDGESLMA